jgi:prevent-host-death family protein
VQVTIHEARTQLSKLIAAADRGEEVIIARRDKPVARLSAMAAFTGTTRIGGLKKRKLKMNANFDDPALNVEIARTLETP